MPNYRGTDPGAFTNAFNTQRQLGAQMREADQVEQMRGGQIARQNAINALGKDPNATPEQYVRAGDVQTGAALAGMQGDKAAAQANAFPQVGGIAAQILALGDPAQQRLAFKQAIQSNGSLFDTMGMPHTDALAKLDTLDDAGLAATLQKLATFAPKAAPMKVAAGESLVTGDGKGGYTAAFTAPNKPATPDDPYAKIDPANFTQESIARFEQTGKRSDLVPRAKPVDPGQQAQVAATLRDDFRNDSKVFQGVSDAYQRVTDSASDPTGAGDVALLYNYLKVLDPASTVREGEFQTVGSSGGLPTQVQGFFSKMVNGKLPTELRSDIVNRATKLYRGQEGRFKTQVLDRYQGLAKRYGVSPDEFSDPRAKVPTSALPPQNEQGWTLHEDPEGNRAYVSPDGKQFKEVN